MILTLLCALDLATAAPEPVSRVVDHELSLSPDGRRIAFISNRGGQFKLYVMNIDGSNLVRLTDDSTADDSPAWSPNGEFIAFVAEREGGSDLHIISADGSSRRQVTYGGGSDLHPGWATDGLRLIFTRLTEGREPNPTRLEVYALDVDSGAERRLTEGSYASWSPDGQHIALWRMFGENADIVVTNQDASQPRRLTTDPSFDGWPSWSPRGRAIVFARERGDEADIYVVNLQGQEQLVVGGPGRKTGPRWSPDGRYIFYSQRHEGQVRLWRVAWAEPD